MAPAGAGAADAAAAFIMFVRNGASAPTDVGAQMSWKFNYISIVVCRLLVGRRRMLDMQTLRAPSILDYRLGKFVQQIWRVGAHSIQMPPRMRSARAPD